MSCPICDKNSDSDYRPFCSKRCADVDLGKWLTGRYALPSEEPVEPELLVDPQDSSGPVLH